MTRDEAMQLARSTANVTELEKIVEQFNSDPDVLAQVAWNYQASGMVLAVLANHSEPKVRRYVAWNPFVPKKVSEQLLSDKDERTASLARKRLLASKFWLGNPMSLPQSAAVSIGGDDIEIRVVSCDRDLPMLEWSLHSLIKQVGSHIRVVVHDGGLSEQGMKRLCTTFQGIEILTTDQVKKKLQSMKSILWQHLAKLYDTGYGRKLAACLLTESERFLIMDSDVMFFRPFQNWWKYPAAAMPGIEMGDENQFDYCAELGDLDRAMGRTVLRRVCSGLYLTRCGDDFRSSMVEAMGRLARWREALLYEETVTAAALSLVGGIVLSDQSASCDPEMDVKSNSAVAKHYVTGQRGLFWTEGVPALCSMNS
jgi:hypothetical protein